MKRVQLQIDQLSLPSMTPEERRVLMKALQAELQAQLASVSTSAWQARKVTQLPVSLPPVHQTAEPAAPAMGRQLARAIARLIEPTR